MSDITNALGIRKFLASLLANGSSAYLFATLHGTGGSALSSTTDAYASSGIGELATGNGYTAGGKTCGTITVDSNTNIDTPDVVWTASGGNIGPASYIAFWINSTNSITGAHLVCVKDYSGSPQTASTGNTITGTITDLIGF